METINFDFTVGFITCSDRNDDSNNVIYNDRSSKCIVLFVDLVFYCCVQNMLTSTLKDKVLNTNGSHKLNQRSWL